MQTKDTDVIVNVITGFPTVQETLNHLNAPPLRADKAERLMEFSIAAKGGAVARLSIPNGRTNQCITNIDGVVNLLSKTAGFLCDYMNYEESEAFHSSDRSKNFENRNCSDMTSGQFTKYSTGNNLPILIVTINSRVINRVAYYTIKLVGETGEVMELREAILTNHTVKKPVQASVKIASVDTQGGLTYTENNDIHKNPQISNPAFYPWMVAGTENADENIINKYLEEFLASNSRVLILIGPASTGKSTLIRTLISQHKVRATLAYTSSAIEHPSFIKDFVASLVADEEENEVEADALQPAVLVMEDSDETIRAREKGNKLMAEFLNTADGIASSNRVKMVFSTNLTSTRDIDVALMRPGRCFDVLPFRNLTKAEAIAARASLGLPEMQFSDDGNYSLAEALNNPSRHGTPEMIKPRFGFK